jgi:hypothetical protein
VSNKSIQPKSIKSTAYVGHAVLRRIPGAFVFPIHPGRKKPPLFKNELELAFNDAPAIDYWGKRGVNWGIALRKSRLVPMDVDTKVGKVGANTLAMLELMRGELPPTLTVRSPSGGLHYYFTETNAVKHRMANNGFGPDVDCPNYLVAFGCSLDGTGKDEIAGEYTIINDAPVAPAPVWFADVLGAPSDAPDVEQVPAVEQDTDTIIKEAIFYLRNDAPKSVQFRGGEKTVLMIAAVLKDRGVSLDTSIELMDKYYNTPEHCDPVWNFFDGETADRMDVKIRNAWAYLKQNAPGAHTAEADFARDPIPTEAELAVHVELAERAEMAKMEFYLMDGEVCIRNKPKPRKRPAKRK